MATKKVEVKEVKKPIKKEEKKEKVKEEETRNPYYD